MSGSISSGHVGVWVGETFAETHAQNKSGQVVHTDRWFQSKKTLIDGLKEAIAATGETEGIAYLASSRAESIIQRRRGSSPAVLTTAGFETSLSFSERNPSRPSLRLSRAQSVISADRVFGVTEKVESDGSISTPMKLEELEFLKTKLELLKSREIAIQFINSELNPAHEKAAAAYFRENGFKVFMRHENDDAIHRAYVEHVVHEEIETLKTAMTEAYPGWTLRLWGADGPLTAWETGAMALGGMSASLTRSVSKEKPVAYFGLEGFSLLRASTSPVPLPVQPTCQIGNSAMAFPSWTDTDRGFEPGPMLLGKSHQLSLLDVLFICGHLEAGIDGFSDRVQEKSTARIKEALFTLGKSLADPGRKVVDALDIASDLELSAGERLATFLRMNIEAPGPIAIAGPLANSVTHLLKKVRPDWTFERESVRSVAEAAVRGAST
ncbi:MAG: hydantoinase/oxoprolinase N-terminal domain-containing protein [Bdellovibrionota bacterium]